MQRGCPDARVKIKVIVSGVGVGGIAGLRELLELKALDGRPLHIGIRKGAREEDADEEGGASTEDGCHVVGCDSDVGSNCDVVGRKVRRSRLRCRLVRLRHRL